MDLHSRWEVEGQSAVFELRLDGVTQGAGLVSAVADLFKFLVGQEVFGVVSEGGEVDFRFAMGFEEVVAWSVHGMRGGKSPSMKPHSLSLMEKRQRTGPLLVSNS
mgnify:CR=1 FL=1